MNDENDLREALARIAEIAGAASSSGSGGDGHKTDGAEEMPSCIIKSLPKRLLIKAAEIATKYNAVNAPSRAAVASLDLEGVLDPQRMAVLTTKYWGPFARRLTVSFMEPTPSDLRNRILSHMNAWTRTGGISFVETSGVGNVRISRGAGGYYSYLGTDILSIPTNRQTMNLQGFSMSTPESEYKRVVRHETGHTLGAPHEHMRRTLVARIDPEKAYEYFWRTQHWPRPMVDAQVLTPLDEASLLKTPADQTSIMCYQLPGSITRDGRPITGGTDINATDYAFIGSIYLKFGFAPAVGEAEEDWPESEDVELSL